MRKKIDRIPSHGSSGWRGYQNRLKRSAAIHRIRGRLGRWLAAAALLVLVLVFFRSWHAERQQVPEPPPSSPDPLQNLLTKEQLQQAIPASAVFNLREPSVEIQLDNRRHHVETSLHMPLQRYLLDHLDRRYSRYIGLVAMQPDTGRVLAMVGYDKSESGTNPCLEKRFPAASIFKIVTAAAAMEELGLLPDSHMTYNGRKHTLYKSQLRSQQNRYTNRTTLRKSFAQSINPVFGKIGTNRLQRQLLVKYADAFGFNQEIEFETRLAESTIRITDDPYQWAEVASGFNQDTRISPLHGALIASVVLNGGHLIEPSVVERVTDPQGRVVYRSRTAAIRAVISPQASRHLADLMEATVKSGTSRSAFRGSQRDWVLSKLQIGGKTGSINSRDNEARYDWFVGFAQEKKGTEKVVVSAMVAHEKYIGRRAVEYARLIIRQYFQEAFASRKKEAGDAPG